MKSFEQWKEAANPNSQQAFIIYRPYEADESRSYDIVQLQYDIQGGLQSYLSLTNGGVEAVFDDDLIMPLPRKGWVSISKYIR